MSIQGLGNRILTEFRASAGSKVTATEKPKNSRIISSDSSELSSGLPLDVPRTELLNAIKNKIKSGFYNSEAVLDDLSYGFADALDKTV